MEEQVEKILSYFLGEMTEQEKRLFELEMGNDETLKDLFQKVREEFKVFTDENTDQFADRLKQIRKQFDYEIDLDPELNYDKTLIDTCQLVKDVDNQLIHDDMRAYVNELKQVKKWYNEIPIEPLVSGNSTGIQVHHSFIGKKVLAAAAGVLLVVLTSVLYKSFSISSNDNVFNNYYKKYNARMVMRTSSEGDITDLNNAIQWYIRNNYRIAINQLYKIIRSYPSNKAAHFYMGLSYIEARDYWKAIENFSFIVKQNNSRYTEHAQWYLALCYMEINQISQANSMFYKIADSENYYKPMAIDILKKIK